MDDSKTTITQDAPVQAATQKKELFLHWVYPKPDLPTTALPIDGHVRLGRDSACDLVLSGSDVSRNHAEIIGEGSGCFRLRDLGSRNGLRVNGELVKEAALRLGDVLRIGGWVAVAVSSAGPFRELSPGLWGGEALSQALAPLRVAAASDLPIVLEGETGTGKEMVARALHTWSGRRGPFLGLNCAALPESLAEGELFGYRKGAFTGADRDAPGLFRGAQGGTLLLDEVSDLPLGVQAKLLRVLQEKEVRPLGETRGVPVDARIVVACQNPLIEAVKEGRFRADLLARMNGLTLCLPPLRTRREDVPGLFQRLLSEHFGHAMPALECDLVERLCLHDWPFNVRELAQIARQLSVLHAGASSLHARHLPACIGAQRIVESGAVETQLPSTMQSEVTLPMLLGALRTARGNVTRAADLLGITRQRAYRMMESGGVDLASLREEEPCR